MNHPAIVILFIVDQSGKSMRTNFIVPTNCDLSVCFLLHIRDLYIVAQLFEHLHECLVHDAVLPVYLFRVINVTHSTCAVRGNISTGVTEQSV